MGGRSMKDVGGAVLAGSTPPFLGRERAAVDVDVGPERRSPRYHETCLALESIKEGSAAVSEPRCVWLRVHIFKDLEKARRLPVRVEEQQAQQAKKFPTNAPHHVVNLYFWHSLLFSTRVNAGMEVQGWMRKSDCEQHRRQRTVRV